MKLYLSVPTIFSTVGLQLVPHAWINAGNACELADFIKQQQQQQHGGIIRDRAVPAEKSRACPR